jgi:putative tricarboxylic transport membrane protein
VTGDRVLGLVMLAFAAGYYAVASAIPESQLADAVGPQGLPKVYALVLAALSLILIVSSRVQKDPAYTADRRPETEDRRLWRVFGMLAIGALYVALVPWLGYIVSLAALIAGTTYYQGGELNRRVALVACSGALFFWLLFVWVLRIPQPAGVWPSFL